MKSLATQFEDDLASLVDRYLRDGIEIDKLKDVLRSEVGNDHEARKRELGDWHTK